MPLPLATVVSEGLEEQEVSSSRDLSQAASGASLAAHTPGPWYADGCVIWHEIVVEGPHGEPERAQEQIGNFNEGDAPLAAAAPELLAACREALDFISATFENLTTGEIEGDAGEPLSALYSAIAKASPQSLKQEG